MERGKVLSLQSHVVSGFVGNKCASFALQTLGIDIDTINTVQFSNHTGYATFKGQALAPELMKSVYEALVENNLTFSTSHVLTGYINNPAVLSVILHIVKDLRTRNPNLVYACDPAMGDNGKLYPSITEEMISAYKTQLLPEVTYLFPNQTECQFLTDIPLQTLDNAFEAIDKLHVTYGIKNIVLTSFEEDSQSSDESYLFVLGSQYNKENQNADRFKIRLKKIDAYFTGTGDLFSSLLVGYAITGLNRK
eukprot:TRINITY_DN5169_c0_g1_i2.p1 TRINITY_DN5169_c0_g1~~TRINITY_DN5169_c0_g1_i2.p1  ORF type:complete len:250 (+),score=39.76 TRINITY_DN5169_c0_g1_i2:1-750(+)